MDTPIFDQVCADHPELSWTIDEEFIRNWQNQTLRVLTINELHTL